MKYKTLREKAYWHIRKKLANGSLLPGARIEEPSLAKELGISRSPVREAIRQIASENLITQEPGMGAFVCIPNRDELREQGEMREALETYAAAKVAREASPEVLKHLSKVHRELETLTIELIEKEGSDLDKSAMPFRADDPLMMALTTKDLEFHMAIITAARNKRVAKLASDLLILGVTTGINRPWLGAVKPSDNVKRFSREHSRIMQAIEQHDEYEAWSAMTVHLRQVTECTINRHESQRWTGDGDIEKHLLMLTLHPDYAPVERENYEAG